MRKIVISVALLTSVNFVQAQCGSIEKGIRLLNANDLKGALKNFEAAGEEIKKSEDENSPPATKCYAKYYYGSGSSLLNIFQNEKPKELNDQIAILEKAEAFFDDFFTLNYDDDKYKIKAITNLEAVANNQKNIAVDYYGMKDYSTSLRLLEKCINNKAKLGTNNLDLHAYQSASIVANELGEYNKAIMFNDVLIKNPQLKIGNKVNNQETNFVKKSEYLNNLGAAEKALNLLDSVEKVFPTSLPIKKKKLQIYTEVNDDESALALLEELTKTVTDDVRYYVIMGRIYNNKGLAKKSYDAYTKALQIDKKNKLAIFGLGAYYINQSNEYVNSLNGDENSDTDKESKASIIEQQHKDFDQAIYYFNQYLGLEPGDKSAMNALKKIYKAKGDETKVEEMNKKLLKE
jgi:tetratricopeptide (TPR) repeat protein